MVTKDMNVARAVLNAVMILWFSFDLSYRKFEDAIENPSASTLEIPRIRTIAGESAAQ
jgi:hypothetical protein